MNQLKWIKGDFLNAFSECSSKLKLPLGGYFSAYYGIACPNTHKFLNRMQALFFVFPRE